MAAAKYLIALTKDEEMVAQLLTRDAWSFFTTITSSRDRLGRTDIPFMPRQGTFAVAADTELIQYYLDYAGSYHRELSLLGWAPTRTVYASNGFAQKLEEISGQRRRTSPEPERLAG